jgi:hypothetical protein
MPRIGKLKVQAFSYVKSIEINKAKNISEIRSIIETEITNQQPGDRNLMEYPALIQIWDVVKEAA